MQLFFISCSCIVRLRARTASRKQSFITSPIHPYTVRSSRDIPLAGSHLVLLSLTLKCLHRCHFILHFCRALGWTQPDLNFANACTALPSLHSPIHTASPLSSCLTQSGGQCWGEREGERWRAAAGWRFGGGCLYSGKNDLFEKE